MIIIPAIDLKDGQCIRLKQGRLEDTTIYSENPELVAREWESQGAELIHIVDIDGAVAGKPVNREVVLRILNSICIPVQIGGGIRDCKTLEDYLNMDIQRVVLGTIAYREPSFVKDACRRFPGRIAVGIDARDGFVAIQGWKEVTHERAVEFGKRLEDMGVSVIIYTDILRDGMMTGPNIEAITSMLDNLSIPLIASGGVSTLQDIEDLSAIGGLEGVIIGRALYTGAFTLKDAMRLIKKLKVQR